VTKAKDKEIIMDEQKTETARQLELTQPEAELTPEAAPAQAGVLGRPTQAGTLQAVYNQAEAGNFQFPSDEPLGQAWDGTPVAGEDGERKLLHPYAQQAGGGVFAQTADEDNLRHSAGGSTTRNDALDLGVPMKQGTPTERQGPEDALGVGPKRGDYRERLGYPESIPHEGAIPQGGRVNDIGDAPGKGGVDFGVVI
jgi:hypothetical protein